MISAFSFLQGGIDLNVFEAVKQSVTTRQAAEHYGIRVNRNGMACCPFHNDKTPSMKLDKRFHCFGCGADGDVIDFVAALYGLGKKEAAAQLASDFGLAYEDWKPPGRARKPKPRQKSPEEQFREAKAHCFRVLADYLHLLRVWKTDYAPHSPEEAFHPRFVEALQKQAHVEYLLDVLLFGETEEKAVLIMVSLAPIPMATFGNHEQSHMGQNYLKCLFALGFQGFLILICVAIYAVLIQSVAISGDAINSIWSIVGYTVLLCFSLFKTSSVTKSVLGAH
jgi:hypothetical protein